MAEYAEARAYGPRKARVQDLRARIQGARKDDSGRAAALRAMVATFKALPPGQRDEKALAEAQKALTELTREMERIDLQ